MNQAFIRHFRCPASLVKLELLTDQVETKEGYFKFGPDIICYGQSPLASDRPESQLSDALASSQADGYTSRLPFNPTEVAENLRLERYENSVESSRWKDAVRATYYTLRPAFPVAFRRHLQRFWLRDWEK